MIPEIVSVWNAATGEAFPLREVVFRQNTVDDPNFDPAGVSAARTGGGRVVGFCIAKVAREPIGADGLLPDRGWISMIAVHPSAQRRGLGTVLLRRGEAFLRDRGRHGAVLGGDPAHFFPGIPAGTPAVEFFAACGYRLRGDAYDLRRSLADYRTPEAIAAVLAAHPDLRVRPLRSGEEGALLAFLDAVFPGRWRYTLGRVLARGGEIGDVMGVVRGGAVLGFAHLFHPGSRWIGPSIAWVKEGGAASAEARPAGRGHAGGLGPMGLAPELRGVGLGLALLDRAVVRLARLGVEEMVIDWTVLLDFYGKLGFVPWKQYRHGERAL